MESLDLKLSVFEHPEFNTSTRRRLREAPGFSDLSHSTQSRLLGGVTPPGWFAAEFQGAAIFISDGWVVSIHAQKLTDCISAMVILLNAIGQQLRSIVVVELLNHPTWDGNPIDNALNREERERRTSEYRGKFIWALVGALIGLVLQFLFVGGQFL